MADALSRAPTRYRRAIEREHNNQSALAKRLRALAHRAREYHRTRSERWRNSDKGDRYLDWIDRLESMADDCDEHANRLAAADLLEP